MKNKILLVITVILSIIYVVLDSSSNTTIFFSNPNNILVKNSINNKIDSINLEEYVIGVVAAEMPASFNIEALKAQAVASRTYAIYKMSKENKDYDVVTDVSNQSYIDIDKMKNKWGNDFNKYYQKIKEAVISTRGKIMLYNDEIVEAYYFAMSNGYTENASLVFSENKDYLQSVSSQYDVNLKSFQVDKEFTKDEICLKLSLDCNELTFSNIVRSNTGRVNSIDVNGKTFKGTTFRKKLSLRSTDFSIEKENNKIIITTKGYGHGVGMSQYGANGMASEGYNYEEILKYYYQNVKISSI